MMNHYACTEVLLEFGASVFDEDTFGFTILDEGTVNVGLLNCWCNPICAAVCGGDPALVALILENYNAHKLRNDPLPALHTSLAAIPDFYVEIHWEVFSWVPLVGGRHTPTRVALA